MPVCWWLNESSQGATLGLLCSGLTLLRDTVHKPVNCTFVRTVVLLGYAAKPRGGGAAVPAPVCCGG